MRFVLSALLLAMAGFAAPATAQKISENFDRGNKERTIAYTADGTRDANRPVLTFNANISGNETWSGVTLAFVSAAGDETQVPRPRFAACHKVEWTVDGQPLAAGAATHQGKVIDWELIELVVQEVTPSWVAAVGAAQSVRYRVCRDEYALTAADIHAFATIAAKLKNATRTTSRSSGAAPATSTSATPEVVYEGMKWRPTSRDNLPR